MLKYNAGTINLAATAHRCSLAAGKVYAGQIGGSDRTTRYVDNACVLGRWIVECEFGVVLQSWAPGSQE